MSDLGTLDYTDETPRVCVADGSRGLVGQVLALWGVQLTVEERWDVLHYMGNPSDVRESMESEPSEWADAIESCTPIYWEDGDAWVDVADANDADN